jgi:hypothetical protein
MSRAVEDIVFFAIIIIGLAFTLSSIPMTRELMRRHQLKARRRRVQRLLELEQSNEAFKVELQSELETLDRQLDILNRKDRKE